MFNLDGGSGNVETTLSQERIDQLRVLSFTNCERLFGLLGGVSYFPRDLFAKGNIEEILRMISNQSAKTLQNGLILCDVNKKEEFDGPGYTSMIKMLKDFCNEKGLVVEIKQYGKLSSRNGAYMVISKNGGANL